MEETQFTIKLSKEDSELIRIASKLSGIGHTSFTRIAAVEKARETIKRIG